MEKGRRAFADKFALFREWMIDEGYSESTARMYTTHVRTAFNSGKPEEDYLEEIKDVSYIGSVKGALALYKEYKGGKPVVSKSVNVKEMPAIVQLAIEVVRNYNENRKDSDPIIALSVVEPPRAKTKG